MALAVASTSTASTNNADNVVVTKPTGVAVGDLLLIAVPGLGGATATCSGFSTAINDFADFSGGLQDLSLTLLYRIADSSDVSASNYTVDPGISAQDSGAVAMLRVTGWTSGNPLWASAGDGSSQDAASFTINPTGLSITRPGACLLLMLNLFGSNDSPYSTAIFSGYSVTSGVSNPTWTEVIDTTFQTASGPTGSFALAYANTTDTSNITEFLVNGATDAGGTDDTERILLCVLCEPVNPTTDLSHINVAPTVHAPTVTQVNTAPEVSHNAVVPTVNGIPTRATAPTQWQNPDKPTDPTWINSNKS